MSLIELIAKHPGKKYHHISYVAGDWVEVIAEHKDKFWIRNPRGEYLTIEQKASESGWSLHLEKKSETWCAWARRNKKANPTAFSIDITLDVFYRDIDWRPIENAKDVFRLEQFDFIIEVTE